MNKIEYINLGGNPLAIDQDAYKVLKQYISSLKSYFGTSEYADEIIQDIEVRLAELIHESMKGRKIANKKDVEYSINIMGFPNNSTQEMRRIKKVRWIRKKPHSKNKTGSMIKNYSEIQKTKFLVGYVVGWLPISI